MSCHYRNKRRNRMNYINRVNGDYLETTRPIGWIMKDGKWWAEPLKCIILYTFI